MEPNDTSRDGRIRALLRKARETYPRWGTGALIRRIWLERPEGAKLRDILRAASERSELLDER
jgi:hypothetical protein